MMANSAKYHQGCKFDLFTKVIFKKTPHDNDTLTLLLQLTPNLSEAQSEALCLQI